MQHHVCHCRSGTLVVHALMLVETLILCIGKGIPHMLGNLGGFNGDPLDGAGHLVQGDDLPVLVLRINKGGVAHFHFLDADLAGTLHKAQHIHHQGSTHNGTGNHQDQQKGQGGGQQNGAGSLQTPLPGRTLFSGLSGRCRSRMLRCRAPVLCPCRRSMLCRTLSLGALCISYRTLCFICRLFRFGHKCETPFFRAKELWQHRTKIVW